MNYLRRNVSTSIRCLKLNQSQKPTQKDIKQIGFYQKVFILKNDTMYVIW